LGMYVHGLKNQDGYLCSQGDNPFHAIGLKNGRSLSEYVPLFNPTAADSKTTYATIETNLPAWIDYAIKVREDIDRPAPPPGAHAIYR
jgi:hypothetical protein